MLPKRRFSGVHRGGAAKQIRPLVPFTRFVYQKIYILTTRFFLHWEPQEGPLGAPLGYRPPLPMGFRARRNAQRGLRERGALRGAHAVRRAGEVVDQQPSPRSSFRDSALSVTRFELVSRWSFEAEHCVRFRGGAALARI